MIERLGVNLTQLTGVLSFASAFTACMIAARQSRWGNARAWQIMGFINAILLVEVLAGLRHRIHDYVDARLMAAGEYGQRHGMQEFIIIALVAIALICAMIFFVSRRLGGAAERLAAAMTVALLTLFAIETVSLHTLDAIYYRPVGQVLLIGWLWFLISVGICWAALTATR